MQKLDLMALSTIGTFVILILLIFNPLPEKNAQIFLSIATFLLGYYFGSSATPKNDTAG